MCVCVRPYLRLNRKKNTWWRTQPYVQMCTLLLKSHPVTSLSAPHIPYTVKYSIEYRYLYPVLPLADPTYPYRKQKSCDPPLV